MNNTETGKFSFLPPFHESNTDEELTVSYKERLSTGVIGGKSIYTFVYKALGISREIYNADVKENTWIIGLTRCDGSILYIPEKYISKEPPINYISFTGRIISVDLGLLPTDEDVGNLINEIQTLVESKIGVKPFMKDVKLPKKKYIPADEATGFKVARDMRITNRDNFLTKITELEESVNKKDVLINQLECALKTKTV